MKPIIDLLATLNPVFQAFTLIVLVIYVWKTWQMAQATREAAEASRSALKEMALTREQEIRPYVLCYCEPNHNWHLYDLVIKNFGKSMAHDVVVSFSPSIRAYDPVSFIEGSLEVKEFLALAPGAEWRIVWGNFQHAKSPAVPDAFTARIRFKWGPDKTQEDYDVSFDIKSFLISGNVVRVPIEESLQQIAKVLTEQGKMP